MEQALAEEESSFLREEMFVASFAGGETKDIVQLNVSGGEVMRRSTLRLCEGSVMYHQFDDTTWCSDDGDAEVLIVQSPYAFGKLINQLRLKAISVYNGSINITDDAGKSSYSMKTDTEMQ
jgi:hypothetical protein